MKNNGMKIRGRGYTFFLSLLPLVLVVEATVLVPSRRDFYSRTRGGKNETLDNEQDPKNGTGQKKVGVSDRTPENEKEIRPPEQEAAKKDEGPRTGLDKEYFLPVERYESLFRRELERLTSVTFKLTSERAPCQVHLSIPEPQKIRGATTTTPGRSAAGDVPFFVDAQPGDILYDFCYSNYLEDLKNHYDASNLPHAALPLGSSLVQWDFGLPDRPNFWYRREVEGSEENAEAEVREQQQFVTHNSASHDRSGSSRSSDNVKIDDVNNGTFFHDSSSPQEETSADEEHYVENEKNVHKNPTSFLLAAEVGGETLHNGLQEVGIDSGGGGNMKRQNVTSWVPADVEVDQEQVAVEQAAPSFTNIMATKKRNTRTVFKMMSSVPKPWVRTLRAEEMLIFGLSPKPSSSVVVESQHQQEEQEDDSATAEKTEQQQEEDLGVHFPLTRDEMQAPTRTSSAELTVASFFHRSAETVLNCSLMYLTRSDLWQYNTYERNISFVVRDPPPRPDQTGDESEMGNSTWSSEVQTLERELERAALLHVDAEERKTSAARPAVKTSRASSTLQTTSSSSMLKMNHNIEQGAAGVANATQRMSTTSAHPINQVEKEKDRVRRYRNCRLRLETRGSYYPQNHSHSASSAASTTAEPSSASPQHHVLLEPILLLEKSWPAPHCKGLLYTNYKRSNGTTTTMNNSVGGLEKEDTVPRRGVTVAELLDEVPAELWERHGAATRLIPDEADLVAIRLSVHFDLDVDVSGRSAELASSGVHEKSRLKARLAEFRERQAREKRVQPADLGAVEIRVITGGPDKGLVQKHAVDQRREPLGGDELLQEETTSMRRLPEIEPDRRAGTSANKEQGADASTSSPSSFTSAFTLMGDEIGRNKIKVSSTGDLSAGDHRWLATEWTMEKNIFARTDFSASMLRRSNALASTFLPPGICSFSGVPASKRT
ncbi:unnamed protein product [Amoebophrya sp. A120]|nr:unnamed protein product [Amoebophrya sp. A120]|eukprot:GSA120T00010600001.1